LNINEMWCVLMSRYNASHSIFVGVLCVTFCAVLWACGSQTDELPLPDGEGRPQESLPDGEAAAPDWLWQDEPLVWQGWGETTRKRALREDRPLLFYVAAPGCEGIFAKSSPLLREMVEERYVGVRVDPFARPDMVRYLRAVGCPALVMALPDGRVFSRAIDIPSRYTALFLQRLWDTFKTERTTIVEKVEEQKKSVSYPVDLSEIYRKLLHDFAEPAGGFYGQQGLAHVRSLRFIWHFAGMQGDERGLSIVHRALEKLLDSPLRDAAAGGYYLYSYTPDGLHPAAEKDALDQAELAHWFLDMGEQVPARNVVDYVHRELYNEETGALHGRQVRLPDGAWWTDPVSYADRSASLLRMLVRVAREQNDNTAGHMAVAAGAFIGSTCIDERGAVWHECGARGVQGLLVDQALVALALEDLAVWSGDRNYSLLAHRVIAFAEEQLYSEERDAFADAIDWPGAQQFSFDDDGQSSGNALMTEWYGMQGDRGRARRLLAAARLIGTELGVAATWARLAATYQEVGAQ
jgi:uncharacterized protein YyaL (SSP411 family)